MHTYRPKQRNARAHTHKRSRTHIGKHARMHARTRTLIQTDRQTDRDREERVHCHAEFPVREKRENAYYITRKKALLSLLPSWASMSLKYLLSEHVIDAIIIFISPSKQESEFFRFCFTLSDVSSASSMAFEAIHAVLSDG